MRPLQVIGEGSGGEVDVLEADFGEVIAEALDVSRVGAEAPLDAVA